MTASRTSSSQQRVTASGRLLICRVYERGSGTAWSSGTGVRGMATMATVEHDRDHETAEEDLVQRRVEG